MANLDLNALGAVLKQKYNQRKFYEIGYEKNPTWSMLRKATSFGGENKVVALRYGMVQGTSPVFQTAQASATPSSYARVTVTRVRDYTVAYIDGEAIAAAKGDEDSIINAFSKEIDSAMARATRNNGIAMFKNSGGSIGRATFSTTTATLLNDSLVADPTVAVNFEKGMRITSASTDGTSGSVNSGFVTITGVNRIAGTLTADQNWTTGISGAANNDFLFVSGAFGARMAGLPSWTPTTAPTSGSSFFGLDRSVDTRLYGWAINGLGGPIKETLIETLSILVREGSDPDIIVLNPLDWSNMIKAEQSNVIYDRAKSNDNPEVGFQAVQVIGPSGPVKVISDLNCPKGRAHVLQLDTWSFESAGPAPRILAEDGISPILRSATQDAYEVRIGWYGNLICEAPGLNAIVTL
jgi:hypothetical protein